MRQVMNGTFQNAVSERNPNGLRFIASDFKSAVLSRWDEELPEDLEIYLRISDQKLARAERQLEPSNDMESCLYALGMLRGMIDLFQSLLKREMEDQRILFVCASQSRHTDQILQQLHTHHGGQGMRHGELAKEIGISESSLTNIMKRILSSGAVESTRSGKNTFYSLTRAGRNYCVNKLKKNRSASSDWTEVFLGKLVEQYEKIQTLLAALSDQGGIKVGDRVIQSVDGGEFKEYRLKEMYQFFNQKYVNMSSVSPEPSEPPWRKDPAREHTAKIPASFPLQRAGRNRI